MKKHIYEGTKTNFGDAYLSDGLADLAQILLEGAPL